MTDYLNDEQMNLTSQATPLALPSRDESFNTLRTVQQPVEWALPAVMQPHSVLAALNRIPLFSTFGQALVGTGSSITALGRVTGLFTHAQSTGSSLATGFSMADLVLGVVDFVRIPLTYLSAWQLGQVIPMSTSKNARVLYASILLGLSITALALPLTAPFIAITTASLGLGVSLFTLGRFFYYKHKLNQELKNVQGLFEKKEFAPLQVSAKKLEESLTKAVDDKDEQKIAELQREAAVLSQTFKALKDQAQLLKDQAVTLERRLEKKGATALLDKTVRVGLSSMALLGIALSLFFPPVGLGIVVATTATGLLYFVGRISAPLMGNLFSRAAGCLKPVVEGDPKPDSMVGVLKRLSAASDPASAGHGEHATQKSPARRAASLASILLWRLAPSKLPGTGRGGENEGEGNNRSVRTSTTSMTPGV